MTQYEGTLFLGHETLKILYKNLNSATLTEEMIQMFYRIHTANGPHPNKIFTWGLPSCDYPVEDL